MPKLFRQAHSMDIGAAVISRKIRESTSKSGIEDSVLPSLAWTIGYGVLALLSRGGASKHAIESRSNLKA